MNRIAQIINKGIYLYYQKTNGKMEELSQEKEEASIPQIKRKGSANGGYKIYLDEEMLTTKETIEFLKISRTTLWRLRSSGRIPYCIISNGRLIRFKLSEILNYVETKTKRFAV